jgi:crossover junction endodeoxyribonuclease RuvC
MLILGIDPGSRRTGWGLVRREGNRHTCVDSGTIRLDETAPLPQRLLALDRAVEALLAQRRPGTAALEQIFSAKNARSALVLGHARGVIVAAIARRGIPLFEYTPAQVKQAVAGTGRADKQQIARMVAVLLNHRVPLQEDEADALAVAITHAAAVHLGGGKGHGAAGARQDGTMR